MRLRLGARHRKKKNKRSSHMGAAQPRTRTGQLGDPIAEALEDVAGIAFSRAQGVGKRLPPRQALQRVGCTVSVLDALIEARIVRKRDADLVRSTLVGVNRDLLTLIGRRGRRAARRFAR